MEIMKSLTTDYVQSSLVVHHDELTKCNNIEEWNDIEGREQKKNELILDQVTVFIENLPDLSANYFAFIEQRYPNQSLCLFS